MKSKVKLLLTVILINIVAILGLFAISNNSNVYGYDSRYIDYFSQLDPDNDVYCIEYGINFQEGQYYNFGDERLSSDVAYVVGNTDPSKYSYYNGIFRTDIRQNYVWESMSGGSHKYDFEGMANDIEELRQEANIVETLSYNSISIINNNGEFVTPDANGKYGPFIINYPSVNGKWVGKDFKVLINGNPLTNIPKSGEEFYLTEDDGIILGEKNEIKIVYSAAKYAGVMSKYTKIRDAVAEIRCRNCGNTYYERTTGIVINNQIAIDNSINDSYCPSCGSYNISITDVGFTDGYADTQDIATLYTYAQPIELEDSIEFWAGRKIEIDLTKIDNAKIPNELRGINFNVSISGDDKAFIKLDNDQRVSSTTITTDANGQSKITIIACKETITVTLTEEDNIFYINNGPIVIDFTYNKNSKTWSYAVRNSSALRDVVEITQHGEWFEFQLKIVNIAKIENLIITKLNKSVQGERLPNIEFQIILKNATDMNNNSNLRVVTDANGNIELGTLKVLDPNEDIVITVTETNVPTSPDVNYKGLYGGGTATITIRHARPGCNVSVIGASRDVIDATYDLTQNIVTFEIYNEVTIDLSGEVWLDGQTGIKPVQEPNNKKDSTERRLENIKVVAKRVSDNVIVDTKYTDANGVYEFKDLPVSITGSIQYIIEFTYDGINYIAVTPHVGSASEDSDGQEIDRDAFNKKFATIVKDKAIGANGEVTNLTYTYDATSAKLVTMNGIDVKPEFAMVATTEPTRYNENTKNIDLGLVKKDVDLAAVTDLYSAKVSINDKTKTYNYNELINLDDNIVIGGDAQPSYNLYLYNSDYNYRIGDYKGLGTSKSYEGMDPEQNSTMGKTINDQLDIELTYQLLLNNQSATTAQINSIAYYYDTRLELVTAIDGAEMDGIVDIDGVSYNKILIPINQAFTDTNNQGIANIVFKVGKNSEGFVNLGEMKTWIEIISYSTDTGCVDIDSAPDNIDVHKTEDDTDDARGLNIQINQSDRTISGFVFEDNKNNNNGDASGDGKYQNNEEKVNDIIIQLIEIKKIDIDGDTVPETKLEYIWQETTTGSNIVKYISEDGKIIDTYSVSNSTGEYTFQDFIPGNYIVRFIYGDGTYWDSAIDTNNILKYNGQDYKSTRDVNYNQEYFTDNSYTEDSSMARDNEARRIKEMGYAMTPGRNADDLIINSKDKLENTWMCAETSIMNIPISDTNDTTQIVKRNINFGLEKRARSELTLEKHVTYVKLDGVTETTADINDYVTDNGFVKFKNVIGKEFSTLSNPTSKAKDERGSWTLETQLDQIKGNIVISYTYRITNIGEQEYLGEELIKATSNGTTYDDLERTIKSNIQKSQHINGTYLGTKYYSGTIGLNDTKVGTRFKIEDYINNATLKGDSSFEIVEQNKAFPILESLGNTKTQLVDVLQTQQIMELKAGEQNSDVILNTERNIDTTSTKKKFTYRSYATQIVPANGVITSRAGTLDSGSILGNLQYIQGNTNDIKLSDIIHITENDEYIGETVTITVDTGADQKSPVLLIASITGGLILVAVGIILIKKFVIK